MITFKRLVAVAVVGLSLNTFVQAAQSGFSLCCEESCGCDKKSKAPCDRD